METIPKLTFAITVGTYLIPELPNSTIHVYSGIHVYCFSKIIQTTRLIRTTRLLGMGEYVVRDVSGRVKLAHFFS